MRYRHDDSPSVERSVRRYRPPKDVVGDWLTWFVRALIPIICYLAWQENQTLQGLEVTAAKMSVMQEDQGKQLDKHSQDIERIWQALRDRHAGGQPQ